MVISFVVPVYMQFNAPADWPQWIIFIVSVAIITIGWVSVTLLTKPASAETLKQFRKDVSYNDATDILSGRQGIFAAL